MPGQQCEVKKIWTSYHNKLRTWLWLILNWLVAVVEEHKVSTFPTLRNGKFIVEISRYGTLILLRSALITHPFCAMLFSLNLNRGTPFFLNAVAPAQTLHRKTVSLLVCSQYSVKEWHVYWAQSIFLAMSKHLYTREPRFLYLIPSCSGASTLMVTLLHETGCKRSEILWILNQCSCSVIVLL